MKARIAMEEMGEKILTEVRKELYLSMPYLGAALDSFDRKMDVATRTIGTDAAAIRYNTDYLMTEFLADPKQLCRGWLHMVLHCIFLHMFHIKEHEDRIRWDIACDIAVESVIDSLAQNPATTRVISDFRNSWYSRLETEVQILTAERIYEYFMEINIDAASEERLAWEFHVCDHSFWDELQKEPEDEDDPSGEQRLQDLMDKWSTKARRMESELNSDGRRAGRDTGTLRRVLQTVNRKRVSYRDFLKRYAVVREESHVDPDSFDYGFYYYGLELYGNMPLIEENEYRESRRVEELVIAIDTSGSCQARLVTQFLTETAAILRSQDSFFHHMDLRILECDDEVQRETIIRNEEDLREYLKEFEVNGGYGTDFRPVFRYVKDLQREGQLHNLRGLLYFTDGYGLYPTEPTPYETVFVFWKEESYEDRYVPAWAASLYLGDDEEFAETLKIVRRDQL